MNEENQAQKRVIYYIPDNFINEARFRIGTISIDLKYLVDMIWLGALGSILGVVLIFTALKDMALSPKVAIVIFSAAPGGILGFFGFNGDPISKVISSFLAWRKNNTIKIYNPNPRLLGTDAVKARNAEEKTRDKLVDMVHNFKEKQMEKRQEGNLVEGENFKFAYDADVDDYLDDNGDFSNFQNSDGSFDINISGGGLSDRGFYYSRDGYNEDDDDGPDYYQSDFETV